MTTGASRSSFRSGHFLAVAGVQGQLRRATQVLGAAERLVNALPLRGERAEGAARIEERRSEAERALSYVELYGAYSETEARFCIDRTVQLFESLSPSDQKILLRPGRDRMDPLHRGRPPAVCRRACPGPHFSHLETDDGDA